MDRRGIELVQASRIRQQILELLGMHQISRLAGSFRWAKETVHPVNHAMVIDCAAKTRTMIKLNYSPMRVDIDWRW